MNDLHQNIITDVQNQIVDFLKTEIQSPVIAENILDIDFQIREALGKQGIITVVMTPSIRYTGDYSGPDRRLSFELDDLTIITSEYLPLNRAKNKTTFNSALDVSIKAAEILGINHKGQFSVKSITSSQKDSVLSCILKVKCLIV